MAIIVFQHHDIGRPGRLGATLRDHGHRLDVRLLHTGDAIPPDFDNVTGVLSLGGTQNVGDSPEHAPWMSAEMGFLREAHARELPVVGICLGAQLLAAGLGGEVAAMEQPEIGFHTVHLSPVGQIETLFAGLSWDSPQFCHHAFEVTKLPPGAALLASSKRCKVQAFRAGLRSYGVQSHFEVDQRGVRALIAEGRNELNRAGYTLDEIEQQIEERYATFARLSDRLCVNIAAFLIPSGSFAEV